MRVSSIRKFFGILGPGLISAVSGLEITNIGAFSYVGAAYGYKLLWVIIFASSIMALLQQLAVHVSVYTREGLVTEMKKIVGKEVTLLLIALLILANIVTLEINLIGVTFTLQQLVSVPWVLGLVSISLIVLAISLQKEYRYLERILTIMSLVLSVYIVVMFLHIIENPVEVGEIFWSITVPPNVEFKELFMDILAIFGAAAAPYALIFQSSSVIMKGMRFEDVPEEFLDILTGLIFATFASISIAVVAAAYVPSNASSIYDIILALRALGPYAIILFSIGVFASSILAIEAIILCNAYIVYEYRYLTLSLGDVVRSKLYSIVSFITVVLSAIFAFIHVYLRGNSGFVSLVKDSSILISFTSWVPALMIVVLYWKIGEEASSFVKIVSSLIVGGLIAINLAGIIALIGL